METVFLAELDILKDTRQDIRKLPWADPSRREATLLFFNQKRAREEIKRLDVEIKRLITAIKDEHFEFCKAISAQITVNPPFAWELSLQWQARDRINSVVVERLFTTSQLRGFSGSICTGVRQGHEEEDWGSFPLPSWCAPVSEEGTGNENLDNMGDGDEVLPEDVENDVGTLVDFVEGLEV